MTFENGWVYLGALFVGASVAWSATPAVRRIALALDVVDRPGGYKTQSSPVPYLGGLALAIGFGVATAVGAVLLPIPDVSPELPVILGGALVLAILGLADDLRGLSPWVRLGVQLAVALAVWWVGVRVDLFGVSIADFVLTVVWIVGIANAMNLLDNMDGLAAGTAAIAGAGFAVIAATNGQFLVGSLAAGVAGCALGFLWHNRHPATIYMGDAGSVFLGFLLAVVGVKLAFDAPQMATFGVPPVVMGVAIFDTCLVTFTRLREGRSPFRGGRDHVSHRLVRRGLTVRVAVWRIHLSAIGLVVIALVMPELDPILSVGVLLVLVVAGFVIGLRVSSWEPDAAEG